MGATNVSMIIFADMTQQNLKILDVIKKHCKWAYALKEAYIHQKLNNSTKNPTWETNIQKTTKKHAINCLLSNYTKLIVYSIGFALYYI